MTTNKDGWRSIKRLISNCSIQFLVHIPRPNRLHTKTENGNQAERDSKQEKERNNEKREVQDDRMHEEGGVGRG